MEYDGTESVPVVKKEPQEFPTDFSYPDNRHDHSPGNSDKSCHSKKGAFITSLQTSTFIVPSKDNTSVRIDMDVNNEQEGLPSKKAGCLDVIIPENFSSLTSESGCSKKGRGCLAIPAEELSAFEQVSINPDEHFLSRYEERFLGSNLSDRRTASDDVDNGVHDGEVFNEFSKEREPNAKSLKETPSDSSVTLVVGASNFRCIRGKRRNGTSPDMAGTTQANDAHKKEKTNETSGSEEAEHQTQSSPNDFKELSFQRMPRKVCEHKRALHSRSSDSLPRACRFQRPVEKKLLQGLGIKRFHCTLCKANFNQSQQLKQHVLEMHEGLSYSDDSYPQSVSITFTCPLCNVSYAWKYCLKRHFASKHVDATTIPCPECKYKAETLAGYLKHVEKHKPKQTKALPIKASPPLKSELKCSECFKMFQSSDALKLHIIGHKITLCLSQAESFVSSEKISISTCAAIEAKPPKHSYICTPPVSLEEIHDQNLLTHLPNDLKLEIELSLNNTFQLASQLEFLARSVRTLSIGCISSRSQKTLLAINHMTSLSTELTNLSTTLGHIWHTHVQVQKMNEKDFTLSVGDPVDVENYKETESVERNRVSLESEEEIVQQRAEGLFEEDGDVLAHENDEIFHSLEEGIFQGNNQEGNVTGKEKAIFQVKDKGSLQGKDEEAIGVENNLEIFEEKDKGSVLENDVQTIYVKNERGFLLDKGKGFQENGEQANVKEYEGENLSKKSNKGPSQENYMRLVLEEDEDFVLTEDLVVDKNPEKKVDEPALKTNLGEIFTLKPPRKNIKTNLRQTFELSKTQSRRSERQALRASKASKTEVKTSVPQAVAARKMLKADAKTSSQQAVAGSNKLKPETKHTSTGGVPLTWEKMVEDHKTSKTAHGYKCQECGKIWSQFAYLKRHLMIHIDLRPFKCTVCNKSFRSKSHVKQHAVMHSDERPFKCDFCDFDAKTAKTLHNHLLTHEERCYPCKKCSYEGRTSYELSKHEEKHNPCSLCGYVASDIGDYRMHKRSHVVYSCTECSFSCHTNWQLLQHSKKHKAPKAVEKLCCELCGYSCTNKRRLVYHMARHNNKTPLSCTVCDYKCSSRASFDAHKLMHAGLKPYLCSSCGMAFRTSTQMKTHMLVHKEEKKHVCRTCGRPFRARHNLRVHEMIHTGERKHKCHLCSFACRRNRELAVHMMKHKVLDGKDKDSKTSDSQCDLKFQ